MEKQIHSPASGEWEILSGSQLRWLTIPLQPPPGRCGVLNLLNQQLLYDLRHHQAALLALLQKGFPVLLQGEVEPLLFNRFQLSRVALKSQVRNAS